MSPSITRALFKVQKPILSLKQFMLRSEVLKLYRGFLRLGRHLNEPPTTTNGSCSQKTGGTGNPMKAEWNQWVRSEFRLRQNQSTDEEITRTLLTHGRRQLQEMERTIMLAINRNIPNVSDITQDGTVTSSCSSSKNKSTQGASKSKINSSNKSTPVGS